MDGLMLYEPADIIIHMQGKGIVVKEKSVVAYQKSDNKIVAVGTEAYGMAQSPAEDMVVVSPLRQGRVADFHVAVTLFSDMLTKAIGKRPILKPAVAVCVPEGITPVEKKALEEVLKVAGARELFITDIPAEKFIREFSDIFPKEFRKYKIIIGIMKDEPERYVREGLRDILAYALQEQIPLERVDELLLGLKESKR